MPADLAQLVDETACRCFEADWFANRRSPIEHYLPDAAEPRYLPTLEELVLIELELAWARAPAAAVGDSLPTCDAPPRVESYLARFPQLQSEEILLRLVRQEYAVRVRCGQTPALEEYRRRFPRLPLTAQSFETLQLSHCAEQTRANRFAPADLREQEGGRFGSYELIAILGRGGMGVVYRARQREAGREVALKVIQSAVDGLPLDLRHSIAERFHTEAVAAARLAHDNIVTVYDVGEHEGRPYYAMRLVEGPSLAEIAREGPLANRRAAAYVEGAARAIHAAHQQGILHRDIKPQNVLVDAQTDRALVADFGLAKLLQDTQSVTRSGELLGTPAYMAPEQIDHAANVGPDSDVYALGATLYHLLTGRPPFQAAALTDTLWQVKHQEPVPPQRLNSAVDRDLDTICLKCLHKDRRRRYASAGDLADDLQRYLNHAPILARPLGPLGRMQRWRKRNPVAAAWLAVAVLSFIALIGVGAAGYVSTVAALAKDRESFRQARQAVDDLHIAVSEEDLLNQPGMQPLRQKLLQRSLEYYVRFLEQREGDRSIAHDLAATYYRVGKITEDLESPARAIPYFDRALAAQQRLLTDHPEDRLGIEALGDTLNARGAALRKMQLLDQAVADLKAAAELREKLTRLAPNEAEPQRKLANSYMNLGILAAAGGDTATARRYAEQGQTLREQLLALLPDDVRLLDDSGKELYNLAKLALAEQQVGDAEQKLRAAIAIFRDRCDKSPADQGSRSRLAACYRLLGQTLASAADESKLNEGFAAYQFALETIESLAADNPRVSAYQGELGAVHLELAAAHGAQRRLEPMLQALEQARRLLEPLAPVEPRYRRDFALALRETALAQLASNQPEPARHSLEQALTHLRELATTFPNNAGYQADLAQADRLMALLQQRFPQN